MIQEAWNVDLLPRILHRNSWQVSDREQTGSCLPPIEVSVFYMQTCGPMTMIFLSIRQSNYNIQRYSASIKPRAPCLKQVLSVYGQKHDGTRVEKLFPAVFQLEQLYLPLSSPFFPLHFRHYIYYHSLVLRCSAQAPFTPPPSFGTHVLSATSPDTHRQTHECDQCRRAY